MNNETIEIKKEDLQGLYETLTNYPSISKAQVINEMEKTFGKEVFKPHDITERVKTFDDACRELGEEHLFVLEWHSVCFVTLSPDIEAYLQLRIICAALNEGWEPQFTEDEARWYPWHFLWTTKELEEKDEEWKQDRRLIDTGDFNTEYSGFTYAFPNDASSHSYMGVASRLCLKSEALADYCGRQFIELWAYLNLIRR